MIRPAHVDEAEALSALALRSKAHWGYDAAFLARCRAELCVEPAWIRTGLCFVSDPLRGFHAISIAGARAELEFLFVEPAEIGRGLGRALFAHAAQLARSRGARFLDIQGEPFARGFYLAMGAREVGTRASASIPGRSLPRFELAL